MKNLIIGFMVGYWVSPVLRETSRQLAFKLRDELEKSKTKSQEA